MTEASEVRPFRVLPAVTPENEHFWSGGADGELRILRCQSCGWWIHPPSPICPVCLGKELQPEATTGRGVIHTFTVNWQPWYPNLDPPYVIAIVELDDQPGLRLTTNLLGVEPDDVSIGMPVEVTFEDWDGVWLPFFLATDPLALRSAEPPSERLRHPGDIRGAASPVGSADFGDASERSGAANEMTAGSARPLGGRLAGRRAKPFVGERAAVISGVGQSQIGRRIYRDPLDLTVDAALAAIEDAGLTRADIDGLSTYPGNMANPPGFSGAGITEVQDALRLDLNWFAGGLELPGQLGSVANAIAAVATGLATHVLCFRTVWEASAQGDQGRAAVTTGGGGGNFRATGFMQWTLPYGAPSAANWIGMMAQRHFHEFGTTREQLAQIALNGRRNAAVNPNAIYRDPMTLDDYLGVRLVSTPLGLYDCDVPADGSTAVIVSRADTAPDLRKEPVQVEAVGTALHGRPSWDQFDDLTTMAVRDAAAMMWDRTDLTPADVDVAELYDGFSFIALAWLEALGFCAHGEGGPFIEGGERIARDGLIPLNTHGGQLSAGRLHGYGFLHEACVQLWGEGGERQVVRPGGRAPEVAVAAAGGGPLAASLLLTRR
jgi:acetyl-CoA acetyltransferase/uncharacterized OB-fold protein